MHGVGDDTEQFEERSLLFADGDDVDEEDGDDADDDGDDGDDDADDADDDDVHWAYFSLSRSTYHTSSQFLTMPFSKRLGS